MGTQLRHGGWNIERTSPKNNKCLKNKIKINCHSFIYFLILSIISRGVPRARLTTSTKNLPRYCCPHVSHASPSRSPSARHAVHNASSGTASSMGKLACDATLSFVRFCPSEMSHPACPPSPLIRPSGGTRLVWFAFDPSADAASHCLIRPSSSLGPGRSCFFSFEPYSSINKRCPNDNCTPSSDGTHHFYPSFAFPVAEDGRAGRVVLPQVFVSRGGSGSGS